MCIRDRSQSRWLKLLLHPDLVAVFDVHRKVIMAGNLNCNHRDLKSFDCPKQEALMQVHKSSLSDSDWAYPTYVLPLTTHCGSWCLGYCGDTGSWLPGPCVHTNRTLVWSTPILGSHRYPACHTQRHQEGGRVWSLWPGAQSLIARGRTTQNRPPSRCQLPPRQLPVSTRPSSLQLTHLPGWSLVSAISGLVIQPTRQHKTGDQHFTSWELAVTQAGDRSVESHPYWIPMAFVLNLPMDCYFNEEVETKVENLFSFRSLWSPNPLLAKKS